MKTAAILILLGVSYTVTPAAAQVASAPATESTLAARPDSMPSSSSGPNFMRSPIWLGMSHFQSGKFAELESLARNYFESDRRSDDGTQALLLLNLGLTHSFELASDEDDSKMERRFAAWHEQVPESALQPIVLAMHVNATAWRARGRGFSSTVTPEGWQLFEARNQQAWKILVDNKDRSSSIPMWYHEAIGVGGDLGMPNEQLGKLFEEGMRRHAGDQTIYSAYMRRFAPLWGGDWESADKFIVKQSAAETNKDGDILYARLYWFVDQSNGRSATFFEESRVDWRRMRRGFEQLIAAFPYGTRSHARFASFACRANDATTYTLLRPKIDRGEFKDVSPSGISVDVCDARFMTPT